MGIFVNISDFSSGRYLLRLNPSQEADLTTIINDNEKSYILKLFGVTLGTQIWNAPTSKPELTDAFIEEINGCIVESKGVKEMIKAFIYFEFVRLLFSQQLPAGVARKQVEGAENKSSDSHDFVTRYNAGVNTWEAIQTKCLNDTTTYPTFKGEDLGLILPF